MPNLDELQHDMSFTVGGETFTAHDVHPDVILEWQKEDAPKTDDEALAQCDRLILTFLNGDEDQVKRYEAMRKRKDPPVPPWKIIAFRDELVETQTGRPTQRPTPSPGGRGRTAPTSGGG